MKNHAECEPVELRRRLFDDVPQRLAQLRGAANRFDAIRMRRHAGERAGVERDLQPVRRIGALREERSFEGGRVIRIAGRGTVRDIEKRGAVAKTWSGPSWFTST